MHAWTPPVLSPGGSPALHLQHLQTSVQHRPVHSWDSKIRLLQEKSFFLPPGVSEALKREAVALSIPSNPHHSPAPNSLPASVPPVPIPHLTGPGVHPCDRSHVALYRRQGGGLLSFCSSTAPRTELAFHTSVLLHSRAVGFLRVVTWEEVKCRPPRSREETMGFLRTLFPLLLSA